MKQTENTNVSLPEQPEDRPRTDKKEWRDWFPEGVLRKGEKMLEDGMLKDFAADSRSARAVLAKGSKDYQVLISKAPSAYEEHWHARCFHCTCSGGYRDRVYREPRPGWRGGYYFVCGHIAAAMLRWEQSHGPWEFTENREAFELRMERERELRRREQEKARRAELKNRMQNTKVPAVQFFPPDKAEGFFSVRRAAEELKTSEYAIFRAGELLEGDCLTMDAPTLSYGRDGGQLLSANAVSSDGLEEHRVHVRLGFSGLEAHTCTCQGAYWGFYGSNPVLCEHQLALLKLLQDYIDRENPGDATDQAAERFFSALEQTRPLQEEAAAPAAQRSRDLALSPKITADGGSVTLSFRLSVGSGRPLALKGLPAFTEAVRTDGQFPLSKAQTVDFSRSWFTEESLPWLTFIQRRVSELNVVNDRLQSRSGYVRSLSVQSQEALTGAVLDRFYEQAEGQEIEFQEKASKATGPLRVGHAPMRVRLSSEPLRDGRGELIGVTVSGAMPVILRGSAGSYILGTGSLSRITREEEQALQPFRQAADAAGNIRFRVGREKLAEFYYRAAPALLENPYVDFEDRCGEEAAPLLPPEPSFTFRLDLEDGRCTCRAQVDYGGGPELLSAKRSGYRDAAQEQRVEGLLGRIFPSFAPAIGWWAPAEDEFLYRLLTEGLPELDRFGEVLGSDAFNRGGLRPMPQLRVGVSLESGLLEIDVLSRDLSPEELLGILESYRTKKRYHRLRSGDFIALGEDEQLDALTALSDGMGMDPEELLAGPVRLPMYRALYLDSMLEAHDALAAGRDRTYRSLIKNFRTIRDADYEVPAAQAEVLRPYQVYGYKWLRTLAAAGFGGILADEMGLGKTVQAIALIQALREEGDAAPALVVCPASLVYNWQEEFRRFAPSLRTEPIAGTAGVRKKLLEAAAGEEAPDVLITSYDLLRKDIAAYEPLRFSVMVLDEAQYIKNQKAGMTKAVKVVQAERRFALTGTPIENRLAELWSIFDFLMPGFLYGYTEFSRRFEAPIVRNRDEEATERLKKMVGPFILRRLKSDVLKDLPPKLEEVRYTRFGDEQRKLYDGQVVRIRQTLGSLGNSGEDKLRVLAELTRIRQICCDPSLLFEGYDGGSAKRMACLELVTSAISGGHRCLIFSQFTSMLALLEEDLRGEGIAFSKIVGATPKEQRLRLVREFNEGDTPVFLISLKAGGTGLNLTGADVVIHYDPWWNLAAQNQATDRAHRIGQSRTVTVYRIIVKDTIEEKILELQNAKRDLAEAVLAGENASLSALSTEELLNLLG